MSHKNSEREVWFRYRPDGMRHSKQVITGSGASGTTIVTTHLWDGQDVVAEMSTNGTTKAAYLRGNGELVAEIIGEAASYYLHNAHGDVVQRVDGSGSVLKNYKYDAFGNVINPATVGNPAVYVDQSPFGYCGEYLDKETGEIYLRARYYDSETGRFNSEDPLRDSANWYAYCGNDPVNNEDPSGLASWLSRAWNGVKNAVSRVVNAVKQVFVPSKPKVNTSFVPRPAAVSYKPSSSGGGTVSGVRASSGGYSGGGSGAGYSGGINSDSDKEFVPYGIESKISKYTSIPLIATSPFKLSLSQTASIKGQTGNQWSGFTVTSDIYPKQLEKTNAGLALDVMNMRYEGKCSATELSASYETAIAFVAFGQTLGLNPTERSVTQSIDVKVPLGDLIEYTYSLEVEMDIWLAALVMRAVYLPITLPSIFVYAATCA